jgi:hypothetical protein
MSQFKRPACHEVCAGNVRAEGAHRCSSSAVRGDLTVKWKGMRGAGSRRRRPGHRRAAWTRFGYLPVGLALCLSLGLAAAESAKASALGPRVPDATSTSTAPPRIGVLTNSGSFLVKQGGLSTGWTDEYNDVIAGAVSGDLIGVLTNSGSFLVKEGGLSTGWTDEYNGIRAGTIWSGS